MAYFSGESTRAAEYAQHALSFAEAEDWDFARLLATDLLGHSLLRAGDVRRGLDQLKRALKLAQKHDNQGLALAIRISILKYEVAHGLPDLNPRHSLSRLEAALKTWVPHDSYSQSELRLELAKQLALRGQVRRARQVLEVAADSILGSRNRSQGALLHSRLAWLARLEGRWSDARLAIRSARQFCFADGRDEVLDPPLLLKLDRMMTEINLYDPDSSRQVVGKRGRISHQRDSEALGAESTEIRVENRILARRILSSSGDAVVAKEGEDKLGDVLDRGFLASLREGLYGTLRDAWEREGRVRLSPESLHLVLGLPQQTAVIFDKPDTRVTQLARRPTLLRALHVLQKGEVHVEDFTRIVWDYSYQPQVHDRLIAVTLTRIRKELGVDALERRGPYVRWKSHLQLKVHFWTELATSPSLRAARTTSSSAEPRQTDQRTEQETDRQPELNSNSALNSKPQDREVPRGDVLGLDTNLNLRQLLLMEEIVSLGSISMEEHRDRNGISRATALRDLNELQERGLLKKVGATRSTRYLSVAMADRIAQTQKTKTFSPAEFSANDLLRSGPGSPATRRSNRSKPVGRKK